MLRADWIRLTIVIMLLAVGCRRPADEAGAPSATSPEPDGDTAAGSVELVETIDGDTFDVRIDGTVERVRLIGMNTPERGECLASEATDGLDRLLRSGSIELEFDTTNRDRFDRLLRHVWIDGVYVNEQLVAEGLAIARSYPPDTRHDVRLFEAQASAKAEATGLWSPNACGPPAPDSAGLRVRIAEVEFDAPGNDTENLNGEWVRIVNDGATAVELVGWSLKDESSTHRYAFPAVALGPGGDLTIRSGCGEDSDTELFWCVSRSAVWNNGGDTAFLLDPSGNIVDSLGY